MTVFFLGWEGGGETMLGSLLDGLRFVGLHVIAQKMKIYSYLHAAKNPYPQAVS